MDLASAITSIKVHTFKPNDILIIKLPEHTSEHEAEVIRNAVKSTCRARLSACS